MEVIVVHENSGGQWAKVDLDPDATPVDVLDAVKTDFGLDFAKKKYVVIPPTGVAWQAGQIASDAGIGDNARLVVAESEQGFGG